MQPKTKIPYLKGWNEFFGLMSTTWIKHPHNASNHAWLLTSTSQKQMVDLSIEFFMSFMDAFETLFNMKIEKKL
jgi:hypothetical protein